MPTDTYPQLQGLKSLELAAKLCRDYQKESITYSGITENATPTEIFIQNNAGYRLTLPNNGCLVAQWQGCAFDTTNGIGTTQANIFEGIGQFSARRAETSFLVGGLAIAGTGFIFTMDDIQDAVKCTVTGQANKKIIWVCNVGLTFAGQLSIPAEASPAFTGIQ